MRAVGEDKRVLMVQFIKGPWKSGEDKTKVVPPDGLSTGKFKLVKMGKGFVGILDDKLPRAEHEKAACQALDYAKKEAASGNWDMIILDEINNAVALSLIPSKSVFELINLPTSKPENWILTGRDAPPKFLEIADLVTEMRDLKHPYNQGIKGRRGLEY